MAEGSGNPGATNVMRIGGKGAAVATLIGDAAKGLLPTWAASHFVGGDAAIAAAALGSFIGHILPVWFGFKGGKGVATALGALFGASLLIGVLACATWLAVALVSRISSLAALVTFTAAPAYIWMTTGSATIPYRPVMAHAAGGSRLSSGHLGLTPAFESSRSPASARRHPASAIIAALSVQNTPLG